MKSFHISLNKTVQSNSMAHHKICASIKEGNNTCRCSSFVQHTANKLLLRSFQTVCEKKMTKMVRKTYQCTSLVKSALPLASAVHNKPIYRICFAKCSQYRFCKAQKMNIEITEIDINYKIRPIPILNGIIRLI